MDYREFVDNVAEDLKKVLPDKLQEADITARQVDKLQGVSYYGLTIQPQGSNVGLSMDLKKAFEEMENGKTYEIVLAEVGITVTEGIEKRPDIRTTDLLNYENVKNMLMIQVIPTEANEEMLEGIPHVEQEDLSIVYRLVFRTDERQVGTSLVTNQMLENYGITAEQLHADAMANAPEAFPANIRSMQEVLAEIMGVEPEMMAGGPEGLYVASCNHGMNGAGCIFYPGFLDQAAEMTGGDFFILPSSVHEVLLVPDTENVSTQELKKMVREVNASEVQPEDRLSDNVYHYDAQEHVFEKAEKYEDRMQAKRMEKGCAQEKKSVMNKLSEKKKEVQVHMAENNSPLRTAEKSL